jgi:hypothetical protein
MAWIAVVPPSRSHERYQVCYREAPASAQPACPNQARALAGKQAIGGRGIDPDGGRRGLPGPLGTPGLDNSQALAVEAACQDEAQPCGLLIGLDARRWALEWRLAGG